MLLSSHPVKSTTVNNKAVCWCRPWTLAGAVVLRLALCQGTKSPLSHRTLQKDITMGPTNTVAVMLHRMLIKMTWKNSVLEICLHCSIYIFIQFSLHYSINFFISVKTHEYFTFWVKSMSTLFCCFKYFNIGQWEPFQLTPNLLDILPLYFLHFLSSPYFLVMLDAPGPPCIVPAPALELAWRC